LTDTGRRFIRRPKLFHFAVSLRLCFFDSCTEHATADSRITQTAEAQNEKQDGFMAG
jgi:hypothetical protein